MKKMCNYQSNNYSNYYIEINGAEDERMAIHEIEVMREIYKDSLKVVQVKDNNILKGYVVEVY